MRGTFNLFYNGLPYGKTQKDITFEEALSQVGDCPDVEIKTDEEIHITGETTVFEILGVFHPDEASLQEGIVPITPSEKQGGNVS